MPRVEHFVAFTAFLYAFRWPIFIVTFAWFTFNAFSYATGVGKASVNAVVGAVGAPEPFLLPPRVQEERIAAVRLSVPITSHAIRFSPKTASDYGVIHFEGALRNLSEWTFSSINVECRYSGADGQPPQRVNKSFTLDRELTPKSKVAFAVELETRDYEKGSLSMSSVRCKVADVYVPFRDDL